MNEFDSIKIVSHWIETSDDDFNRVYDKLHN